MGLVETISLTNKAKSAVENITQKFSLEEKEWNADLSEQVVKQEAQPQNVSIFTIDKPTNIQTKIDNVAGERLDNIANNVINKENKKIKLTKRIACCGAMAAIPTALIYLPKLAPLATLTIGSYIGVAVGIAGLAVLGAALLTGLISKKRKANYSKYQAEQHKKADINTPLKTKEDWLEKLGNYMLCEESTDALNEKTINQNADEVYGEKGKKHRGIYISYPEDESRVTAGKISIVDATIDSGKYDGLSPANKGMDKKSYQIEKEYAQFIKEYLKNNSLTQKETDRLNTILKALETTYEFSAERNDKIEDRDLFDLSGDGKLNYGDIAAMKLAQLIEAKPDAKEKLKDFQNWDINKLTELSKMEQEDCVYAFDINDDGNVDEKDFELYKKMDATKFDINADGKLDETDTNLLKAYFTGLLQIYRKNEKIETNIENIMGGQEKIGVLEEYFKKTNPIVA